jgi:hypothetical protein
LSVRIAAVKRLSPYLLEAGTAAGGKEDTDTAGLRLETVMMWMNRDYEDLFSVRVLTGFFILQENPNIFYRLIYNKLSFY